MSIRILAYKRIVPMIRRYKKCYWAIFCVVGNTHAHVLVSKFSTATSTHALEFELLNLGSTAVDLDLPVHAHVLVSKFSTATSTAVQILNLVSKVSAVTLHYCKRSDQKRYFTIGTQTLQNTHSRKFQYRFPGCTRSWYGSGYLPVPACYS
eukprot:SAG11_NODE_20_length_25330_cov_18.348143_14_plen_151_part_00